MGDPSPDYGTVAPPRVSMDEPDVEAGPTLDAEREVTDNVMCSTYGLDMLFCFNSCIILPERESLVQLFFGKYKGTITEPGCYCRNACLVELRRVSRAMVSVDLPNVKTADARGSPLIVSGIVTYEVADARRAAIDVTNAHSYVMAQAPAVLKRVVAQFPYESDDESPCLRQSQNTVTRIMTEALQARVNVAGVRVESMAINELSYAPEIANAMLKKQQAGALVEARAAIVKGATDIARTAITDNSDTLTEGDRSKLMSNLLLVLVADKEVTPTVAL